MADWVMDQHGLCDYDEVGGERQIGKAYSIRYLHHGNPDDGLYALVTVLFYSEDRWELCGEPATIGDVLLTDVPPTEERFGIGQQVEFMLCRDPLDPGSSQEWCDYVYRSSWFRRGEAFTEAQIRALMEAFKPEWIYWDGAVQPSHQDSLGSNIEPTRPEDWDELILTPELRTLVASILREIDRHSIETNGAA